MKPEEVFNEVRKSANPKAGAITKTTLPNGVEMSFAYIPAGKFLMGSTNGDSDEQPIHTVKITQGFWMQTTEVTQAQWKAVMGALPKCDYGSLTGDFLGDNKPVSCVNWDEAQEFVCQMNATNDGYKYRLPSEAEWEYAARAGTTGDYAGYLDAIAWYDGNSGSGYTHDVATKQANAWGLYDMYGNVWEWCQDWYGSYSSETVTDPTGATSGWGRVTRGGGWGDTADFLRSTFRTCYTPSYRRRDHGFRLVRQ